LTVTATDPAISQRARAIAEGLIRTDRAHHRGVIEHGMLRLTNRKGGFYWISLDGSRLLRGDELFGAEELQGKFRDSMERVGR
jgi:hypothetical protein